MGQYHKTVCIERKEGLDPHELGCGLKELEQIFTYGGICASIIALVCARGGNGPADLGQSTMVGRWAGCRTFLVGDYAEDDDIPNFDGPPLTQLYGGIGNLPGTEYFDAQNPVQWPNIAPDMAALLEAACNIRFYGKGGWRDFVVVKQLATAGADGVGRYDLATKSKEALEYYKRAGLKKSDYQRVPRSGDWHGLRDNEVDIGQARVIVNLDTMEYLDPIDFGEVPTVGGMMRGEYGGIATALYAMLTHPEKRGGGDLPTAHCLANNRGKTVPGLDEAYKATVGRWRGSRVLGTGSHYPTGEDWPTTEFVRANGTNVSAHPQTYLRLIKDY